MKRIGVISDTHGLLREEVLERLQGCDVILHGGDINRQPVLDKLEQIAPVIVVRGNNDKEWAEHLPERVFQELFGIRLFMIHNKKQIREDISDRDLIIYGHSHKYEERREAGQVWLNPGSCGPRRFHQPITMAIVELPDGGGLHISRIDIPHGQAVKKKEEIPKEIREIVIRVMRDTDKGRSIEETAKKEGITPELAEQICRLHVTHPGVDADGILDRMGLRSFQRGQR